jgi:hypothetical protein
MPAGSFPLTSIAVCETCGGGKAGNRMGEGRRAYRCTTNQRKSGEGCERPTTISADPLEEHVRELLLAEARAFEDAQEADPSAGWIGFEISEADLPTELEPLQDALDAAESELKRIETMDLPDAAKAAAIEAQDRAVTEAREDLERARAEAEGEASPGYVEPWEITQAPPERLPELLSGVRVVVEPGRGRVAERVRRERP